MDEPTLLDLDRLNEERNASERVVTFSTCKVCGTYYGGDATHICPRTYDKKTGRLLCDATDNLQVAEKDD